LIFIAIVAAVSGLVRTLKLMCGLRIRAETGCGAPAPVVVAVDVSAALQSLLDVERKYRCPVDLQEGIDACMLRRGTTLVYRNMVIYIYIYIYFVAVRLVACQPPCRVQFSDEK
jgi:hypothetical protein